MAVGHMRLLALGFLVAGALPAAGSG
eukprot:SAG22_NODE_11055_length_503_cov_0.653465_2_plen_25_part_01